ncbi:MAG TPA: acyl-CoA dehydrogenase family protein [Solirubrobacteraceae bacterium]|jgi:alkylation response protein AidB-like acyl-CoA dehydrogenase
MDFALTPEQTQIRQTLRQFFEANASASVIAELDATATYPADILDGMASLGLWGIAVPNSFGGSWTDRVTRCVIIEEIQRAGACLGYAFIPTALFCCEAIDKFGSEALQHEMLPALAAGRLRAAMALSEPNAGSDLMSLATRGMIEGDELVLRGQKIFTTGADAADEILTLVRTDRSAPARSALTFVLVPRDAPGLEIASLRKLAGQGTHTCEVFFDDVRVGRDRVVGEIGSGAAVVFELLDADRIYTAAQSLGIAQGAFDLARQYACERRQFGRPIIEHQAVGHMLADMEIAIDAARLLTYRAATLLETGVPCGREASMAKIAASEAGSMCASNGMQILGGYSYMVEYGMERYYREAKIQEIFAGTNQILRNVLARELAGGMTRGSSSRVGATGRTTSGTTAATPMIGQQPV